MAFFIFIAFFLNNKKIQKISVLLFLLIFTVIINTFSQIQIKGKITDVSGNKIENAAIQISSGTNYFTISDSLGVFKHIIRKPQIIKIKISHINYNLFDSNYYITKDTFLLISLQSNHKQIKEILVTADKVIRELNIRIQSNNYKLNSKGLGETDIIAILQQKAGIIHSSEIHSSLNVRGMQNGYTGVYYDGTEIFGPNHLLSIYPQYNSDAIQSASLSNADFSSVYGGFLSSYLFIVPNKQFVSKLNGSMEVGILTTKLSLNIPILKNKITNHFSIRRSYFDLIAKMYNNNKIDKDVNQLPVYGFTDINNSLSIHTRQSGLFFINFLYTTDYINFNYETTDLVSKWNSYLISAKWLYSLSQFTEFEITSGASGCKLNAILSNQQEKHIDNYLNQLSILTVVKIKINQNIKTEFGFNMKQHDIKTEANTMNEKTGEIVQVKWNTPSYEVALFSDLHFLFSDFFKLKAGCRFERFNSDTLIYKLIPTITASFKLKGYELKVSYSQQTQFKHLNIPTEINMPLNVWYPSGKTTPPENAYHYNLSVSKTFFNKLFVNISAYYIHLNDLTEFFDGNYLTGNSFITASGNGYCKGIEASLSWSCSKLNIDFSYTIAESKRKSPFINHGEWYSPSYDIRQKADLSITYKIGHHWIINLSQYLQDGFVMSMPTGIYLHQTADGSTTGNIEIVPVYTKRSNFRMPYSHRMDISITRFFKWKQTHADLSIGVYNVYNQHNSYFVFFVPETNEEKRTFLKIKEKTLLPLIPFLNLKYYF